MTEVTDDRVDLIAEWTVRADDLVFVSQAPARTRLGLVVLLKFFEVHARFPTNGDEIPASAIEFVATQAGLGLFDEIPSGLVSEWRRVAGVESPSHLLRRSEESRLVFVATLLRARERELTDTLVDLFIATVHRINARADRKVTKELTEGSRRVTGKENLLFKIAAAAVDSPDDAVRDMIFPAVKGGEVTLRELVYEFKANGPLYAQTVRATLRESYTNHYRKGLIELLDVLEFDSNNSMHRHVIDALGVVSEFKDSRVRFFLDDLDVPVHKGIVGNWATLVFNDDLPQRRVVRTVYEICTFQALREQLRCKEVWVHEADRWRNPDDDLPADFDDRRLDYYTALRQPLDASDFIDQLRTEMEAELAALDDVIDRADRGKRGPIRLSPLDAVPEPASVRALKAEVGRRWGTVPMIDMLKEAVLRSGCLDNVTSVASRDGIAPGRVGRTHLVGHLRLRDHLRDRQLQRSVNDGLDVVESWNRGNSVFFYGKGGDIASNRRDEQELSVLCLRILQTSLVYVNTLMIQDTLNDTAWSKRLTQADRRGLTPLFWSHVAPARRSPPQHGPPAGVVMTSPSTGHGCCDNVSWDFFGFLATQWALPDTRVGEGSADTRAAVHVAVRRAQRSRTPVRDVVGGGRRGPRRVPANVHDRMATLRRSPTWCGVAAQVAIRGGAQPLQQRTTLHQEGRCARGGDRARPTQDPRRVPRAGTGHGRSGGADAGNGRVERRGLRTDGDDGLAGDDTHGDIGRVGAEPQHHTVAPVPDPKTTLGSVLRVERGR